MRALRGGHLGSPRNAEACWRCGRTGVDAVGPIVYEKNDETLKRSDKQLFEWRDPAAFYSDDKPYTTIKSSKEDMAVGNADLASLINEKRPVSSAVGARNPNHQGWQLIIPCTNPANNKTFDHRQVAVNGFSRDSIRKQIVGATPGTRPVRRDGWDSAEVADPTGGDARFVRAAARLLIHRDWAALSAAVYRDMHESPAAFDVFSGLLWSLRGKVVGLPSKNAGWLVLKLMASVPADARLLHRDAVFCPFLALPQRQPDERRKDRTTPSPYPVSAPRGTRLESDLRRELDKNMRQRSPERVDWASLCFRLDQLLD